MSQLSMIAFSRALTSNQVPEDLQSILTDSGLHSNSAELTTKEILSRYGDIVRGNVQASQRFVQGPDAPAQQSPLSATNSARGTPNGPVVQRVDADPYQSNAWQIQSSVRPVQNAAAGPMADNFAYAAPSSPNARQRSESQGSQGSLGGGHPGPAPLPPAGPGGSSFQQHPVGMAS